MDLVIAVLGGKVLALELEALGAGLAQAAQAFFWRAG